MSIAPERERIARRIARIFSNGDVVNLGIGMPTMVGNYLPEGVSIILHSENGFTGLGPTPAPGSEDPDLTNAGAQPVTILPGGAFFDSLVSFSIIRGGHLDYTVLGALEVDQEGNLANYMIPGKFVPGMGGAMDLTVGARKVVIATEHCNKNGDPKVLKRCSLPLTATREVDIIVTELAYMEVTPEGLVLKEIFEGSTVEAVTRATGAELIIPDEVGRFS
ncbi:MAG: 3-oxoacid CoA-transferase subunit B [Candidatus Wallbacteria bacterium]|nr:3-oxoacid CoA-transferase subunit B [Candidatus Wallbacteria bacterium]